MQSVDFSIFDVPQTHIYNRYISKHTRILSCISWIGISISRIDAVRAVHQCEAARLRCRFWPRGGGGSRGKTFAPNGWVQMAVLSLRRHCRYRYVSFSSFFPLHRSLHWQCCCRCRCCCWLFVARVFTKQSILESIEFEWNSCEIVSKAKICINAFALMDICNDGEWAACYMNIAQEYTVRIAYNIYN